MRLIFFLKSRSPYSTLKDKYSAAISVLHLGGVKWRGTEVETNEVPQKDSSSTILSRVMLTI